MKKLKTIIQYECVTSFKYIWYFYAIEYAVAALVSMIIIISTGDSQNVGLQCLETNTLGYIAILGLLGYSEDFKMLQQNGFTRKYIFGASISMFAFIAGIMALVDTVAGNVLHGVFSNYESMYGSIYGYENVFANWIWLFSVYMFVCCLMYFLVLTVNRIGRNAAIYLGVAMGGVIILIIALFQYALSDKVVHRIAEFVTGAMGFMADGSINRIYPVLTFSLLAAAAGIGSYAVIRHIEVK